MDIQYLQTFRTVLARGTYSGAAQQLNYTQSTVTAQMKKLAALIGEPPFVFQGRHLKLTTAGQKLVPLADQLLATYDQIAAINQPDQIDGTVRISVPESLMLYGLGPLFAQFARDYPLVNLIINNATCVRNRERVIADQADIALMLWPRLASNPQLTVTDFGAQPCSLVSGVAGPATLADLRNLAPGHFISNEPECGYRQAFERFLQAHNLQNIQTMEVWSLAAIKQTVIAGLGFSYLPDYVMQAELKQGQLKRIRAKVPSDLHVQLLTRRNDQSRGTAKLVALLKDRLNQQLAQNFV